MTEERRPASVFANVDQDQMLDRIEASPVDEADTGFFQHMLTQSTPAPALDSGIRVFGGGPAVPQSRPEAVVGPATPVIYRGDLPEDPAARRAFILHGPSGVRRPVG